jgi:HupE / UreJ protein
MQEFWVYFSEGRKHIADLAGNDHILFIAALCLRYALRDWRKILILVTAFTIGHSVTLALSVLNIVKVSTGLIEFLIPVTIMITALSNCRERTFEFKSRFPLIYFFALFFGLIHGLGFSNYLKSMMGKTANVVTELLAFNLGLELGQLLIVVAVLLLGWVVTGPLRVPRREYLLFVSGGVFLVALLMAVERL